MLASVDATARTGYCRRRESSWMLLLHLNLRAASSSESIEPLSDQAKNHVPNAVSQSSSVSAASVSLSSTPPATIRSPRSRPRLIVNPRATRTRSSVAARAHSQPLTTAHQAAAGPQAAASAAEQTQVGVHSSSARGTVAPLTVQATRCVHAVRDTAYSTPKRLPFACAEAASAFSFRPASAAGPWARLPAELSHD